MSFRCASCDGTGRVERAPSQSGHAENCRTCRGTGLFVSRAKAGLADRAPSGHGRG